MDEYNKLMNALQQTLTDIQCGGEVSLIKQVISMKEDFNKQFLKKQIDQQNKIKSLQEQIHSQNVSVAQSEGKNEMVAGLLQKA